MKRRLVYLAIAFGLIPWLWVGSYIGFRELQPEHLGGWRADGNPAQWVMLPDWALPLKPSYESLARIDYRMTGTRVIIGPEWSNSSWR